MACQMKITKYNKVMNLMQFRFGQSTMMRDDSLLSRSSVTKVLFAHLIVILNESHRILYGNITLRF